MNNTYYETNFNEDKRNILEGNVKGTLFLEFVLKF